MTTSTTTTPDLDRFYQLHQNMRIDSARLAAAVAGLTPDDRRTGSLARWARGFTMEIEHHHSVEDNIFFPALAERVPLFAAAFAPGLDDDHHHLHVVLATINEALADLGRPGAEWADAHGRAVAATAELHEHLMDHLAIEDNDVLPLYARHFTAAEYEELDERAVKSLQPKQIPFTVPWVVAHCTDAQREVLLKTAPLPLKLAWYATRGRFARMERRAFDGIAANPLAEVLTTA
jgi:hemerythrin-like domain-containing protein